MRFLYFFLLLSLLSAEEYQLGRGIKVNNALHLGGYFSGNYTFINENKLLELDDVAILAYGTLAPQLSYFVELEAAPYYIKDLNTKESNTNTKFSYERFYLDYHISEMFNLRLGKQITPIGYWNLEPINVLRNTSSNPFYSRYMFPKLLTGLDIYGYLDDDDKLNYHFFLQHNKDLDKDYVNIPNEYFYGITLNYETDTPLSYGGTLGRYRTKQTQQIVNFIEFNAKYDNYPFLMQSEFAYNDTEETTSKQSSYQLSGYIQGEYNFSSQHAIVSRYEYIDNAIGNRKNHIAIIGYSYRPTYSVSIKTEYQMNSDSAYNKAILSLSVLF